jgi:hypothetical protein
MLRSIYFPTSFREALDATKGTAITSLVVCPTKLTGDCTSVDTTLLPKLAFDRLEHYTLGFTNMLRTHKHDDKVQETLDVLNKNIHPKTMRTIWKIRG